MGRSAVLPADGLSSSENRISAASEGKKKRKSLSRQASICWRLLYGVNQRKIKANAATSLPHVGWQRRRQCIKQSLSSAEFHFPRRHYGSWFSSKKLGSAIISLVYTATALVYLLRYQLRSICVDVLPTNDVAAIPRGGMETISGTTQVYAFLQE